MTLILIWIFLSYACAIYAERIGRDFWTWLTLSLLFSPLISTALLLAKGPRKNEDTNTLNGHQELLANLEKEIEATFTLSKKDIIKGQELKDRLEKYYIQFQFLNIEQFDNIITSLTLKGHDQLLDTKRILYIRNFLNDNNINDNITIGNNSYNVSRHWLIKKYINHKCNLEDLITNNLKNTYAKNQDGIPLLYSDAALALNMEFNRNEADKIDQNICETTKERNIEDERIEKRAYRIFTFFILGIITYAVIVIIQINSK